MGAEFKKIWFSLWIFLLGSTLSVHGVLVANSVDKPAPDEVGLGPYCASIDGKITAKGGGELTWDDVIESIGSNSIVPADNQLRNATKKRCDKVNEFCYTFWFIDPYNKSRTAILLQGCWDLPDREECGTECIATIPVGRETIRNNTRFCCCSGDMCNVNVTDNVNFTAYDILRLEEIASRRHPTVSSYIDPFYKFRTIIIALSSVLSVAVLIIVIYAVIRCCILPPIDTPHDLLLDPESSLYLVSAGDGKSGSRADVDFDDIKLHSLISRGRYGEVYRGSHNGLMVAVKSLYFTNRQYYENERDIFTQPLMDEHTSIVEYIGSASQCNTAPGESPDRFVDNLMRGGLGAPLQYIIVTAYAPYGNLTTYLKNNVISWSALCRMAQSIISGLAHLHTELSDGGRVKPTIVHRDINSRNILVKEDLTCCICDFGFAMKIVTTRLIECNSSGDVEKHTSLADVGTLRYMAPEVLEGSVNLHDCRSSLTQVDIYAFGLVLWEIGSRCKDLYQGLPTPEYKLPFEQEVGPQPTFEEMQVLVSQNKVRPMFPDTWKNTNPAMKSLKETIEDCWDQDAEARISAVCVEERCRELPVLWEQRQKYIMPTSNLDQHLYNDFTDMDGINKQLSSCGDNTSSSCTSSASTCSTNKIRCDTSASGATADSQSVTGDDENSVSTATVDTMMTPLSNLNSFTTPLASHTPAEPVNSINTSKLDCNAVYERTIAPHREHRGVNPTVARNTHKNSDEELSVEGNALIDRRSVALAPSETQQPGYNSLMITSNFPMQHDSAYLMDMVNLVSAGGGNLETSTSSGRQPNGGVIAPPGSSGHTTSMSSNSSGFTAPPDTDTLIRSGILQQTPPVMPVSLQTRPPKSSSGRLPQASNGYIPGTQGGMMGQNTASRNQRIPYTQNSVGSSSTSEQEQIIVRPKKQNIPSNGGINHLIVKNSKKAKVDKQENQGLSAKFPVLKKLSSFSFPYLGVKSHDKLSVDGGGRTSANSGGSGCNSGSESPSIQSEVLLVNGSPVTRPSSLPLHSIQPSTVATRSALRQPINRGNTALPLVDATSVDEGQGQEERRVNLGFEASVSPRSNHVDGGGLKVL